MSTFSLADSSSKATRLGKYSVLAPTRSFISLSVRTIRGSCTLYDSWVDSQSAAFVIYNILESTSYCDSTLNLPVPEHTRTTRLAVQSPLQANNFSCRSATGSWRLAAWHHLIRRVFSSFCYSIPSSSTYSTTSLIANGTHDIYYAALISTTPSSQP